MSASENKIYDSTVHIYTTLHGEGIKPIVIPNSYKSFKVTGDWIVIQSVDIESRSAESHHFLKSTVTRIDVTTPIS